MSNEISELKRDIVNLLDVVIKERDVYKNANAATTKAYIDEVANNAALKARLEKAVDFIKTVPCQCGHFDKCERCQLLAAIEGKP